ncbi:hypothetical protein OG21DRAFT_1601376 [Imleria badia]|nr:hypothetical protein OG21DRAFT_1601376 [Imleria badia]
MPTVVHNFTRLFADLWNKIKRDSSKPTLSISEDDIVVFVVGPTGSGKSWVRARLVPRLPGFVSAPSQFIKEATRGEWVKSSRGYHPFTTKVQAIRCELNDEAKDLQQEGVKNIVFVDTPSFLTESDDFDAQKEIRTWVDRPEYRPRHLGMIYMHRIETDPGVEPIQKHLRELAAIPRIGNPHHPLRLHIVISYDKTSGTISDSKITERVSNLRSRMDSLDNSKWQPSMHPVYFQGEPEVAWSAVEYLFRTDHGGPGL